MNDPTYLPFLSMGAWGPNYQALPEEVRQALEEHSSEIRSAEDLQAMVENLLRKR